MPSSPWFSINKKQPNAKLRLFCFPYAGGSAQVFSQWENALSSDIEVVAIQPPGRGARYCEDAIDNLPDMVDGLMQDVLPFLDRPYLFFGHSNGALISFSLAQELQRQKIDGLQHIVVSGKRAPQIPVEEKILYNLPDDEFIQELKDMNGTPQEVFDNPELLDLLTPTLRADFALSDKLIFNHDIKLNIDMTLFGGTEDPGVGKDDLLAWRENVTGKTNYQFFEGDHFFINSHKTEVLSALDKIVQKQLERLYSEEVTEW